MKSLSWIMLVYLNCVFPSFGQAPDTLWTKLYGGVDNEKGTALFQTSDGGFIITGFTYSYSLGQNDLWLIKTDSFGDTSWTRTFGDSTAQWGGSVQQTSDGGYIIGGSTWSHGSSKFDSRPWLLKTDSWGSKIWDSTYNNSGLPDLCRDAQMTSDGGYIATGIWGRNVPGCFGCGGLMLLKVDSNGKQIWRKEYSSGDYNEGYSVKQTYDGGYVVVGGSDDGGNEGSLWLLKTDVSGDTTWTKKYGGLGFDCGFEIQQTKDGGYIMVGEYGSTFSYDYDLWLLKTNSFGDTLWTKTFGGYGNDEGYSVDCTSDGGYIICGCNQHFILGLDDFWIIKTDSTGSMEWDKILGGLNWDWGESIQQTADGGYIAVGVTESFGAGGMDVWLIKLGSQPTLSSNEQIAPTFYTLHQNYPNPFNPSTKISWQSPVRSWQTIKVFDVLGNEIATLVNEDIETGYHSVEFDASNLPSGVYIYRITADDFVETKKMLLLR